MLFNVKGSAGYIISSQPLLLFPAQKVPLRKTDLDLDKAVSPSAVPALLGLLACWIFRLSHLLTVCTVTYNHPLSGRDMAKHVGVNI